MKSQVANKKLVCIF